MLEPKTTIKSFLLKTREGSGLDNARAFLKKNSDSAKKPGTRTITFVITKVTRNFFFKLFLAGFIFLSVFSTAVYYFESRHVFYRDAGGVKVEDEASSSNIRSLKDAVWWAFVTSTTVGYGDYYPKSAAGRLMGILLMFFGVSLVGVVTGNIASALVEKQLKEGRGLKELKLKNHFILCGWKRDMADILYHIMEKNPEFLPSDFVLINTAGAEEIENLKSDSRFSHINYIHGDYIDERVLKRARLKDASRVIVFADRLVQGSVQEVDSRTVMAIITIKSMSKTIYTCAEIIDEKFERYLRFSNCDEIILSTEYNRSIIANASAGSGISHVISALLNVDAEVSISTQTIPARFAGKSFGELFDFYMSRDRTILIGILENTGNFYTRKTEAIRDAQKTPDISKLVDSLKDVKQLVANMPVINPKPEYVITHHSKAIIIEGRARRPMKQKRNVASHAVV
ncbi:MAG: ion transporter [Spirochaetes bacterium]|nr:ion transporter [Spirochaetota bacterium]